MTFKALILNGLPTDQSDIYWMVADELKKMAKRLMPRRMYLWFGNLGWRRQARKNGALDKINARPIRQ